MRLRLSPLAKIRRISASVEVTLVGSYVERAAFGFWLRFAAGGP